MSKVRVNELKSYSPAALRIAESEYVLERFVESTHAPHDDTLFLLTTYFDAFLFCYVSVEEMLDSAEAKQRLQEIPAFRFFKALRNIATHHSVLSGVEGKFPRPITQILKIGAPQNAVFCLIPEKLDFIFTEILKERPGEARTIEMARKFVGELVQRGGGILIDDLMRHAIAKAKPNVA